MGGLFFRKVLLVMTALFFVVCIGSVFGQEKHSKLDSIDKKIRLDESVIGKAAILILKEERKELEGRITKLVEGGIVFDANRQSLFFDPKEKFYAFEQIESLVDSDGQVLYDSSNFSISELLEKHTKDHTLSVRTETENPIKYNNRFRVNVDYGFSRRTAKLSESIPAELKDFINAQKTGTNISADFAYFVWKKYGIGIRYSRFSSSHFQDNVTLVDQETGQPVGPALLEEDVTISLVGPAFFSRGAYNDGNIIFIGSLMAGRLNIFDEVRFAGFPVKIEGVTIGLNSTIGLDFLIARDLAIGLNASFTVGSFSHASINGQRAQKLEEKEDIDRFDFNIGLKLYR